MTAIDQGTRPSDLADETIATVRRWLAESANAPRQKSARRLNRVLADPRGLDFTLGFVDRVVRPEDLGIAGRNLQRLSRSIPEVLPWYLRLGITVGGALAPIIPWLIVPGARSVFRRAVSHLVIDATPAQLDKTLARLRQRGIRLNLNLLGEAVLGNSEADRRLAGTRALLERDDVDYVSIKVTSIASQLSMWAFEETVERVVSRLTPLYEFAAASPTTKFINLDMEEYRDLDLTIAVFEALLDQPRLHRLEAGIALQAYFPDALSRLQGLTAWATARRARGGAGIKVRVVKGANLGLEQVDAALHGWPLAPYSTKVDTDANYKRVLGWAFTQEHTDAVRVGVAGHNLFDLAFAWTLSKQRRVAARVDYEMLLGMATDQADAVRRDVGGLLLYTPVVHPGEFDSAINYLVRRLEENASADNYMSGAFDLARDEVVFAREANRFLASLGALTAAVPASHRVQDREHPDLVPVRHFRNEPDTDPSVAANRGWGRRLLERTASSELGEETLAPAKVKDAAALDELLEQTARAGAAWGALAATERARVLHDAGDVLAVFRGRLIEVMASETGKTIAEGDVEVSEAVDFAHYYADRALDPGRVTGALFVPSRLIVVTPPWNFPVAIPAGSVLAALASGSGVVIKPAPQARRCAAVMVEALWEAGIPRDLLRLVDIEEDELGQQIIAHPAVGRVILTGAWETAALFRSWQPDLPLLAETSGKNAIVVTGSADFDLAVADIVKSAFGHTGQKCSAASLLILVGSVAKSERFRRQLVDAVRSLHVDYPQEPSALVGPIIEPAHGKLLKALTTLDDGESWLVKPRQLDATMQLWSPGVRTGVAPGSEFHRTEYFGPVLGIMTAATLDEAIGLQNATDFGLTAGIQSLDPAEVSRWLASVEAGNLYVNRGITGAIVSRQPFGGWKRSSVGTGAKAGGPNYLYTLGDWEPVAVEPTEDLQLEGISEQVAAVITRAQPGITFPEFESVRMAALSDERAWVDEFGVARDISALGVERNVFRYLPCPVTLRLAEDAPLGALVRLIAAAARAGSELEISSALPLPSGLRELLADFASPVTVGSFVVETDPWWHARVQAGDLTTSRVRLIGGDRAAFATILAGNPDIAIYAGPVTAAGRIELLPFLREQSVSITAHRFGNPDPAMRELPV